MDYLGLVETVLADRPRLFGSAEIGERIGVSRQRVQQLAERDDFPEPYQELRMGRVWLEHDIELWIVMYRSAE
ncbi:helix-turn-helix transcriptional regulator [Actinoplanes sp. HUAS TT8]|uniref:helix-turn-helix transcriptional regulator n=1 Tax=Actinoplanes sp. HUAS TT8 TaxID=3447453 RepID=UPI003F52726C